MIFVCIFSPSRFLLNLEQIFASVILYRSFPQRPSNCFSTMLRRPDLCYWIISNALCVSMSHTSVGLHPGFTSGENYMVSSPWNKTTLVEWEESTCRLFKDINGLSTLLPDLSRILQVLDNSSCYHSWRRGWGRGWMLASVPGTSLTKNLGHCKWPCWTKVGLSKSLTNSI